MMNDFEEDNHNSDETKMRDRTHRTNTGPKNYLTSTHAQTDGEIAKYQTARMKVEW